MIVPEYHLRLRILFLARVLTGIPRAYFLPNYFGGLNKQKEMS